MINIEKNIKMKKKVLIFDIDGVLLDSKKNMQLSWKAVQKKFQLNNIKFLDYFSRIGQPFEQILIQLDIKKNFKEIKECYDRNSIINKKKVIFYKNIKKEIKFLHSLNYILCIVTSKDKKRTDLLISDLKKYFKIIQCPQKNLRGKPHPDQIINVIKKLKEKKKECVYIGDTNIDFLSAKRAKIDFIFAEWGYGINNNYKYSLKNIQELKTLLI
tara:strand:+ start:7 stop:648 length:642 start_codon:yes stop_codon:yes gene_type:complete